MTKRGDVIVTALVVLSAAMMVVGVVALPYGGALPVFAVASACYAVLLALFLEVYARRG